MKNETMLHEEIQNEFEELKKIEVGSDKYKTAVDGLTKLMDRAIEIDKLNVGVEERLDARNIDAELRQEQLEADVKDRKVRNVISIAGIVIPTAVTIWGTLKSLKFEETGTLTTNAGRNFMNRIFKK